VPCGSLEHILYFVLYARSASQVDCFFLYLLFQLTDFGLSKVGLINSTDDLSGPAVSGTSLLEEDESHAYTSEDQRERRKKRSAVGTPDYLAPEILLGTGHGSYSPIYMFKVVHFLFSFSSLKMKIKFVYYRFFLEMKLFLNKLLMMLNNME